MFHATFVQIKGKFSRKKIKILLLRNHKEDELKLGDTSKGKFSTKKIKILLLRNHKEDEAETWHTSKGHCPLQKLCFLFRSDKNSGCYGNLNAS